MLVIGGTGTLGRQIVRRALDEGYVVKCIVRPRQQPADFLRDWGAITVQADLKDPTSLPAALVGVHTIIDCATARPEEPTIQIDWEGKVALIQCAQAMKIQRYLFCSIVNCEKHPDVPLMSIKHSTEKYLENSGLDYTIFQLTGFMQSIIGNYAVPILEDNQVWGTSDNTRTAYLDTLDVARIILASLRNPVTVNQKYQISGPKAYTTSEIISICEQYADTQAKVIKVPIWVLKFTRNFLKGFQWARDASDRLAFAEVLGANETFAGNMDQLYQTLDIDKNSITTLESYLSGYYKRIIQKLKEASTKEKDDDFYF